jgi:uncharacterized repeat protein (TIGR01451 family)
VHFLSRLRQAAAPLGLAATTAPLRSLRRTWGAAVACAVAAAGLAAVPAQGQQITLARTWEGPFNYVVTGTTLRTQANGATGSTNACQINSGTTTATVSGIPNGATVDAAYLYWAGSGASDPTVTFNGTSVTADRTAADPYVNGGTTLNFFGAAKDVTGMVSGNGPYTLSGLTVTSANNSDHCESQAVMGSWSLVVVYREAGLAPRRIQLRDGLLAIRYGTETISLTGFTGAATPSVRLSYIVHEGDPDQDGETNYPERVRWNGTTLTGTANNGNAFNSTANGVSNVHGLDIDTFTPTLAAGATSATLEISSGPDLVLAQTAVTSIAIAPRYGVTVTPDGLAQPVQRLPGTGYALPFTIANTGNIDDTYNLILSGTGNPLFAVLDSVRGPGLVITARADSARLTVPSGQSIVVNLWYSVPVGTTADNTGYLRARSAAQPATLDDGWAQVRRVSPRLTIAKSVSPNNNLSPGTDLTYTMQIANAGNFAARGVVVNDSVPPQVIFKLGSVGQTLPAGITATASYSNNAGATWTYVPVSAGCGAPAGYDACVRRVRWTLTGDLPAPPAASQSTFTFVARVK